MITNVIWYRAKFLLRARGFSVSFFGNHWQDLKHLSRLINSEKDPTQRARAQRLRLGIFLFLFLTLTLFGAFIATEIYQMH